MANLVLLSWPLVVMMLFSKLDIQRALILSILVGYLILPPLIAFYVPGLPPFDKSTLPTVMAALLLVGKGREARLREVPPYGFVLLTLIIIFIGSPLVSNLLNGNELIDGNAHRPGLTVVSGVKDMMKAYVQILPFLLGYRYLGDARGAELTCRLVVMAMLWYSILMLAEVRLSPQMNVWVYGFFQHDFIQTIRYGGFRPIVFLEHPLWVASLTATAFMFSIGIFRANRDSRSRTIMLYLGWLLLICKSAGALLLSALFIPLLGFLRPRLALLVACALVAAAVAYPMLRSTPLMPAERIVEMAKSVSEERGRSLEFRLMNEEDLLVRAMEKPLWGWGGSGRSLIIDPFDGKVTVIPDGLWVIYLGARGMIGYLATFLLLASPVVLAYRAVARAGKDIETEHYLVAAMAVAVAINIVDLIPNATLTPITWLVAGTALGNARRLLVSGPSLVRRETISLPLPQRGLKTIL